MNERRRAAEDEVGPPLIGALVRRPAQAILERIVAEVHAAGYSDFVPAHLAVLRYPGPDGRRPSELAAETGMTRQAMNYLLGQLDHLGYTERVEDPDDGRSKVVGLTPRGRKLFMHIRATAAQIEVELEAQLG